MKKCLLFNSPIYHDHSDQQEEYLPPLGLGYIATKIKESSIDVTLVDCVKQRLGVEEILGVIKEQVPDYMGINIFTQNYDIVKEIVEKCPIKTKIIIGGQVVKWIYEEILQWNTPNKLIIIIGEGEYIIPALLAENCEEAPIIEKNENVVYKVDEESIYFPKDLSLVYLDRSFFEKYIVKNHYNDYEAAIVTSRGCIYNCAFCGGARDLNLDIIPRYRKMVDVEYEIKGIIKKNPLVTSIRILDDLFLRNRLSIEDAITMFKNLGNVTWRGMAHVLTFKNAFDLLPELKQSGCKELFIGIETGSPSMRKKINKLGTVQEVVEVVSAILSAGIDVKGYFIYGFPEETKEDAEKTYSLALLLNNISKDTEGTFRPSVFQFRPYHGTQLYKELVASGKVIEAIKSNKALNIIDRRSQFNFQSGNYSKIEDADLQEFILKTQVLGDLECLK